MSRANQHFRTNMQRLRAGGIAPTDLGSSVSGPWALRPKRLQWLSNIRAGFKIAAFPVLKVFESLTPDTVTPAQAGAQLSSCFKTGKLDASRRLSRASTRGWHDGRTCSDENFINTSRALPQFFFHLRILIGRKAMAETVPPIFSNQEHNSS